MADEIALKTSRGSIKIVLLRREAPLAGQFFAEQHASGAWSTAQFHKVEPTAIYLGPAHSSKSISLERHPRIRFDKRGLVAYAPGTTSELVFCRGASSSAAPKVGTIFGCASPDSIYLLESIANDPKEGTAPLHPVRIISEGPGVANTNSKPASPKPAIPTPAKRRRVRIQLKEESDEEELPTSAPAKPMPETPTNNTNSKTPSLELGALMRFEAELQRRTSLSSKRL